MKIKVRGGLLHGLVFEVPDPAPPFYKIALPTSTSLREMLKRESGDSARETAQLTSVVLFRLERLRYRSFKWYDKKARLIDVMRYVPNSMPSDQVALRKPWLFVEPA